MEESALELPGGRSNAKSIMWMADRLGWFLWSRRID